MSATAPSSEILEKALDSIAYNIDERLTTPPVPQLLSTNTRLQLFDTSSLKLPHTLNPSFVSRYFLAVRMNY